ncbi:MAG: hypothetical protein DMF17_10315 [Verrucomicrobia bacterium]|nr:MAG: hypothetical protein DMF17_10315 [Verrucomicrobiota bacterium]
MKARANILGSARGSRAGEAGPASWTSENKTHRRRKNFMIIPRKSSRKRDAFASKRDACATRP